MIQEINDQLSLESKERVRQYNELHFMEKLVENGWYVLFYFKINVHNNLCIY